MTKELNSSNIENQLLICTFYIYIKNKELYMTNLLIEIIAASTDISDQQIKDFESMVLEPVARDEAVMI